jgi:beta-lactamase regulating signal transducer with metallopeptidase domain
LFNLHFEICISQFALKGDAVMHTILTINGWAEGWLKVMAAVVWQSALLILIAVSIAWLLRRSSPVVRYWLWQIVAIKLLLMPFWTFAIPLPSWPESSPPKQAADFQSPELPSGRLDRPVPENRFALTEGPSPATAPRATPAWEKFASVAWQTWILSAWFVVVFWQVIRLLIQHLRLKRLLKQGVPASGDLAGLVTELAGQIGLRRAPIAVRIAGECPLFVCGLLRPRLVLPDRLLDSLNPAERRQVILHELAHIKRWDLLWGWPVEIARIVYFFNPLVYWVSYRLRLERELACDQLAMARSGHSPADYARTLVQVVSHASQPASVQAAAIAAGLTGSEKGMRDEG